MKFHLNKEECYERFLEVTKTPASEASYTAFSCGWWACANEINNGEDSDLLQERLYAEGFLIKEEEEEDNVPEIETCGDKFMRVNGWSK